MCPSWKCWAIFGLILFVIWKKIKKFFTPPPIPKIEENWWGRGDPWDEDTSIRPFEISYPEKDLQDLKHRLENTRPLVPPLEGTYHQYGMNTKLLQEILDFWRTKYNWREREKYLNKYPQFLTNIQGLDIHYIHVKPENADNCKVLPLILLHGWPGSVREFYEIIPILTKPDHTRHIAFEVIVPSIPGYGFSQAAVRPGLGAAGMAVIFKNLMKRLGFNQFYVQGGDFGAIIFQHMSVLFPEHVLGFHTNMTFIHTPLSNLKLMIGSLWPTLFTKKEHIDRVYPLKEKYMLLLKESGYFHMQATKPDTIGVAMNDSPAGLAAYILEKFVTATDRTKQNQEDGGLKDVWKYEDLIDNIMFYWITGSMPTAFRLYSETFNREAFALGIMRIPVRVPTAYARFRYDFYTSDGCLYDIFPKMLHLADYEGGHFAAFQLPEVLAQDIFIAVEKFEKYHASNFA